MLIRVLVDGECFDGVRFWWDVGGCCLVLIRVLVDGESFVRF